MSDRGEYDTPEEDDDEEEEEGECSGTSDEGDEEEDEENCDPSGLFDALAAAYEAEERYRQKEKAAVSEEDRISEDAITVAFKEAISGGWLVEDEEDQTVNKGDIEEGALVVGEDSNWKEGDRCLAVFSEDGETYNAKIVLLKHWKGAAVVHFFEYGNQEEVKLEDLRPNKRIKKRKGSGFQKHRIKSKKKKARNKDEDTSVWSQDASCD